MKLIKYLLMGVFVFALASCSNTSNDHLFHDDQLLLTQLVYNTVVEGEESIDQVELVNSEFSNEFVFEEMRIINSSYFTTELGYQLDPYISKDMVGKEIEVVVSILELYSPIYEEWYSQEMLIFKYEEELTGFMTPFMSTLDVLNEDNYLPYSGKFVVQSSVFMSGNKIKKYHTSMDVVYTFIVDLSDKEDISIHTMIDRPDSDYLEFDHDNAVGENYQSLQSDIALDLVERSKISKVYFEAVVTRVDEEAGEILCLSSEEPTIASIRLFYDGVIYNQDGEIIALSDLEEGDRIESYYFERYPSYQPKDITVTRIDLK